MITYSECVVVLLSIFCNFVCEGHFKCFFFFQAEDGIRDYKVTGVKTCALPIYGPTRPCAGPSMWRCLSPRYRRRWNCRSEERRVGKECRSRWLPYHSKKKKRKKQKPLPSRLQAMRKEPQLCL